MSFNAVEFGERLHEVRKLRGMTQDELAQKLNVEKQHISRMENGTRACSIDLLVIMSDVLETSTDYLLLGKRMSTDHTKNELLSVIGQLSAIVQMM